MLNQTLHERPRLKSLVCKMIQSTHFAGMELYGSVTSQERDRLRFPICRHSWLRSSRNIRIQACESGTLIIVCFEHLCMAYGLSPCKFHAASRGAAESLSSIQHPSLRPADRQMNLFPEILSHPPPPPAPSQTPHPPPPHPPPLSPNFPAHVRLPEIDMHNGLEAVPRLELCKFPRASNSLTSWAGMTGAQDTMAVSPKKGATGPWLPSARSGLPGSARRRTCRDQRLSWWPPGTGRFESSRPW